MNGMPSNSQKKPTLVVKIGTNVLSRENGKLDYNLMQEIVEQLCAVRAEYRVVLVSSGAVGAGRQFCDGLACADAEVKKQMLASVGQGKLLQFYQIFFDQQKQPIAQALITKNDFKAEDSFRNVKNTLNGLLDNEVVPIVNENDVVSSHLSTFGDNDQLAALTASLLEAQMLVILSDVRGLYTSDPKTDPRAEIIGLVERIGKEHYELCRNTLSAGGSGGMFSKIRAAEIANSHGIPVILGFGKAPNAIAEVLAGEHGGTHFLPRPRKKLSARGAWMKLAADVRGIVTVDDGAAKALADNGSLLAVGIRRVEKDFKAKEVLLVQNRNMEKIGVGLSKHDSDFLKERISSKQTKGVIAIHKNDLYTF